MWSEPCIESFTYVHQVGLGEGFAPSAATAVLAKQVPENERSRAVATVFGGLDLGSAIGLLICGPLIRLYGWPCVFYLFAIVGLVWCLAWPLVQPKKVDAIMWRNSIAEGSTSANGTTKSEDQAKVCYLLMQACTCIRCALSWHMVYGVCVMQLEAHAPGFNQRSFNSINVLSSPENINTALWRCLISNSTPEGYSLNCMSLFRLQLHDH